MIWRFRPQPEQTETILIIGLGNPGRDYRESRHNIGFMVIDHFAQNVLVKMNHVQHKAIMGSGMLFSKRIILAKPQTFMNLSGQSVGALAKFYKTPLDRLLVIHDDLDLPFGTLRIRGSGGSAGQKGLASIIERLGTQDFPRLRMGIGRPPGNIDPATYVLERFFPAECESLPVLLDQAVEAIKVYINIGLDSSMNLFNGVVIKE